MSISSYRPGVYSSYTVTPSYTGAVEALTVGVIGELGMSESGPVRIGRERVLDAGTPLAALGGILFAAGLPEFWVCSLQQGEDGARPDAAAYKAAMEALGEAGMQSQVSDIRLEATQLMVRYAGRFDVKMKLNADFSYDVRLMRAIREKMEEQDGEGACGSMDLTRSPAVYAPAQPQLSP